MKLLTGAGAQVYTPLEFVANPDEQIGAKPTLKIMVVVSGVLVDDEPVKRTVQTPSSQRALF